MGAGGPAVTRAITGAASMAVAMAMAALPAASQTLQFGEAVRITPTARLHADVRQTGADGSEDVDLDLARRRVGVAGRITSRIEFEVERDIDAAGGWRDAFVDVRATRGLQVRAGHFKVPFSREQLTGAGSLDFIDRSRVADQLAPGRSAGVALHGRVLRRIVGYEAGAFAEDGTRRGALAMPPAGEPTLAGPAGEPTLAGRLTIRLQGSARRPGSLGDLEFGIAAATTETQEARASLRGRLTTKAVFFAPVLVSGRRLRVGGDLDWRPGPLGLRAEFLRADDARQHQGLLGETLPPLRSQGWYVSGVWAVAGRRAHAKANDRLTIAGLGGLELAVRTERLSFGTPAAADGHVWTPRAEQISHVGVRAWTLGVNWTLNRVVRLQANAVREEVVSRARGAAASRPTWTPVARVQLSM
jgi:phosphate-selective porin